MPATEFTEDLTTLLAALDVDTELLRVACAEIHDELRHANIYSTLLCRVGACRSAGVMSRGAIRVFGYTPDLRTVPVGDCGQHDTEDVARAISNLIEDGRRDAESRAAYPEAWVRFTEELWIGYRWKTLDALARM
jgi:hypothetical protein